MDRRLSFSRRGVSPAPSSSFGRARPGPALPALGHGLGAGGCGHAYGSPNWRAETGWREGLQRPGALSLVHLRTLLEGLRWWELLPERPGTLLIRGAGLIASNDYAVAARRADGHVAVAYLPSHRTLEVDLGRLPSGEVRVRWFNPRDGTSTGAGTRRAPGKAEFTPPGEGDWVLVLEHAATLR